MPREFFDLFAPVTPNGQQHKDHMAHAAAQVRDVFMKLGIPITIETPGKTSFRGLFIRCETHPTPQLISRIREEIGKSCPFIKPDQVMEMFT